MDRVKQYEEVHRFLKGMDKEMLLIFATNTEIDRRRMALSYDGNIMKDYIESILKNALDPKLNSLEHEKPEYRVGFADAVEYIITQFKDRYGEW